MAFNGNGEFTRLHQWVVDKSQHKQIDAQRFDDEEDGIVEGLSNLVLKDGTQITTATIPFASGIKLNDGTVSAPSIAILGDTDTGFYRIGDDNIGLAVGGVKKVDFGTATASINAPLALATPLATTYGGLGTATANSCRVFTSASQTIATASDTAITFPSESFDAKAMHGTSSSAGLNTKINIIQSGVYLITGTITPYVLLDLEGGQTISVAIKKNGTTYLAKSSARYPLLGAALFLSTSITTSAIASLTAGDYVQLVGRCSAKSVQIAVDGSQFGSGFPNVLTSFSASRIYA